MLHSAAKAASTCAASSCTTSSHLGPAERLYSDADVQSFRHHYDACGLLASGAHPSMPGAVAVSTPHPRVRLSRTAAHVSGGALDPHLRSHFSSKTQELLGSLAAFRTGLQSLEQTRRRRNAALVRDPADWQHITWANSLPPGTDSPYPTM